MAHTAHKTVEQMKEHYDSPQEVQNKVYQLVQWINESKHCIIFTGAGVSTSTGIPDFRGPQGVWTLRAQNATRTGPTTPAIKAIPSDSHMSIVELMRDGMVKYLVSQNTDGLHRKSLVPLDKFSELHGNSCLEYCKTCGKQYLRDFRVRNAQKAHEHETGRLCDNPKCKGKLYDSIINFGENLPKKALQDGFEQAELADLCIVLGSSLTVTPAADIPKRVAQRGKRLVIVNLQKTPLNDKAAMVIHAKTDDVMRGIMEGTGREIPSFRLRRQLVISNNKTHLTVETVDRDGTPFDFLQTVTIQNTMLTKRPYEFVLPKSNTADIKLQFYGHYNEPDFTINHSFDRTANGSTEYCLSYDPFNQEWSFIDPDEDLKKRQEMERDLELFNIS